VAIILLRTRRARCADLAALHDRQRTTSRPSGRPPAATSRTWSAVRSADGWAGRRSQPGHQSPTMARWSATTRRRRSRSLASLWRSGRRTRLAWSRVRLQSVHLGLPRTALPQPRRGGPGSASSRLALTPLAKPFGAVLAAVTLGDERAVTADADALQPEADEAVLPPTHGAGGGRGGPEWGAPLYLLHARRPPRRPRRPAL
jgi:hypothetical protein